LNLIHPAFPGQAALSVNDRRQQKEILRPIRSNELTITEDHVIEPGLDNGPPFRLPSNTIIGHRTLAYS
jgi:hypothetical protein